MGYPVSQANAYYFEYRGQQLALGIVPDEVSPGTYIMSVFNATTTNSLIAPGGQFPIWGISNSTIEAVGSVHDYLALKLPGIQKGLEDLYLPSKPPFEEKPPCMAYDLATGNVTYDPITGTFILDPPPLNHAE